MGVDWNESGVAGQVSIRCTLTREILQFSITSTSGAEEQISTIDPEDCPELDAEDSFWIGMHENKNGDHRDLHKEYRRQRQMCIRDRYRKHCESTPYRQRSFFW